MRLWRPLRDVSSCFHFTLSGHLIELHFLAVVLGLSWGLDGKRSTCNAGDSGSIPGLGRSSGEGNGYPLQYSCLEKPVDRGAWQTSAHGVAKSGTQLSNTHTMKYYSATEDNEILPFAMWMDLESIMLHKRSQKEKDKYSMLSTICGI